MSTTTTFLNKMFRKESKSDEDEDVGNVCIVQLTFDFEERLLGTVSSVPVISSQISVLGLGPSLRLEMVSKFPKASVQKGHVLEWGQQSNNNVNDPPPSELELGAVMKSVTAVLSFVRGKEFSIVGATVDSSTFSGYVTKTYCWTLQK